jgi:hypothetical protein
MSKLKILSLFICLLVICTTAVSEQFTEKKEEAKTLPSVTYYFFDG